MLSVLESVIEATVWVLSAASSTVVMVLQLALQLATFSLELFTSMVPKLVIVMEGIATAVIEIGKLLFGIFGSLSEFIIAAVKSVMLYTYLLVTSALQITTQVVGYVLNLNWSLAANYVSIACTAVVSTLYFLAEKAMSLLSYIFSLSLQLLTLIYSILAGIVTLSVSFIVGIFDTSIYVTKLLFNGTYYAGEITSKMNFSATAETLYTDYVGAFYTDYVPYLFYSLLIIATCFILYKMSTCISFCLNFLLAKGSEPAPADRRIRARQAEADHGYRQAVANHGHRQRDGVELRRGDFGRVPERLDELRRRPVSVARPRRVTTETNPARARRERDSHFEVSPSHVVRVRRDRDTNSERSSGLNGISLILNGEVSDEAARPTAAVRTASPTSSQVQPLASSLPVASSASRSLDSSAVQEDLEARFHLLQRELEREKEAKHCVVCLDRPRNFMIKPCNHYCVCEYCKRKLTRCPMCSRRITSLEKVYNS